MLPGRTVEEHCRIVGCVAKRLLAGMPACKRRMFPEGAHLVAAVHDLGKVFPYFQGMIHKKVRYSQTFPQLEQVRQGAVGPHHASVSQAALLSVSPRVAEIAGWHHGRVPENIGPEDEVCGGPAWQALRRELLARLLGNARLPEIEADWQSALLKGLTAVADWIGSGERFEDPAVLWEPLIEPAVREAGMRPVEYVRGRSFEDIFGFCPNEIQRTLARTVTGPGVYVLEAPMGTGKTEAALFAAYAMLASGRAGGLYFALPTQLTSDKIYDRLLPFLRAILAPQSQDAAVLHVHSMAWLYAALEEEGEHAGAWFEHSKRALLAPFGAGTIDQALMAVIRVRHAAVRSYGLAGKVVILDEVHSYDAYTGTLLDALIEHLTHLGCTVIVLSATLVKSRLSGIVRCRALHRDDYPLVTAMRLEDGKAVIEEMPCGAVSGGSVQLGFAAGDEAVEECLARAEQGQYVLWIENTVRDAQNRYRLLAGRAREIGIETGLLHSRYTQSDRRKNEERWTRYYGKQARDRGQGGRILIGTQVLEQSLDIDADFLVTRLCPSDMLLQRMGRLWRHPDTPRPAGARREAWILAPALEAALADPKKAFGVSAAVYAPYVLARTLEVWRQKASVRLPDDIRPLLEATYQDRENEPSAGMGIWRHNLAREIEGMRVKALSSQGINQLLPDSAATRLIAEECRRVFLVRGLDGGQCVLADGRALILEEAGAGTEPGKTSAKRAGITAMLYASAVNVPLKRLAGLRPVNETASLRRLFLPYLPVRENYESVFLARICPDDRLEDLCTGIVLEARYTASMGWEEPS